MEAGGLQQVHRAFNVDALIKRRLEQAGPDAGSSSEVNDLVEPRSAEQVLENGPIAQVPLHKRECPRQRLKIAEVGLLDLRVVKIVEIVEDPNGVAVAQQAVAHVIADESGAAGDQEIHGAIMEFQVSSSKFQVGP